FKLIQQRGRVEQKEMYHVFNMGIGMVLVCSPENVDKLAKALPEARVIGEIVLRQIGQEKVVIG
ncbi:MAG: phosphoribosylformylglycinamidine cyclo-ligase, partial [Chloroflexi bacterium]|nr:phosphoribosylformylglycinamidine cyclo-ligase [Chloroflexota bacterium]